MRARHNLPAPTLGVSTLSPRNQPEGMMTSQVNMRSDPVRKLSRRPPMEYVGRLDWNRWKAYHTYDRGGIKYEVGVTTTNEVRVLRDGVVVQTAAQDASVATYLSSAGVDDLVLHTIADTTFILNTAAVVEESRLPIQREEYIYINVTSALNYGEKLDITLQWEAPDNPTHPEYGNRSNANSPIRTLSVQIVIPDADGGASTAADAARATNAVAAAIETAIDNALLYVFIGNNPAANSTGAQFCNATSVGSVVSIDAQWMNNLTVQIDGGQGADALVPITTVKQNTEGMPKYAVPGTIIEIQPGLDSKNDAGSYFLLAESIGGLNPAEVNEIMSEVYWTETASPTDNNRLTGSTMPIVVTQTAVPTVANTNDTWTHKPSGDADSSPMPAFVGKTISAMTTFQGRLVFAAGDELVMSNTDDIYLFFRKSVLQLLATDAVSLGASSTDANEITGLGIHNRDLIVNFPKKQFKVSGSAPVTPLTTAMTPSTTYETSAKPRPLPLAGSLLLPFSYGDSGGIWDYTQNENNEQNTAVAVTAMVEGYLPTDIDMWAASSTLDMVVVKCATNNILYVYEQNTSNGKRTQMAWSEWHLNLDETILWIGFSNNELTIISSLTGHTDVRKIDMSTRVPDAPNTILLDDLIKVTVADGETVGTIPSTYPNHDGLVFVQSDNCAAPYYEVAATRNLNDLTVPLSVHTGGTASTIYIGRPYSSEFTPTRQFIREDGVVVDIDRLSVKQLMLDVVHTNEVRMDTISDYYEADTVIQSAGRVGTVQLGVKPFHTGDFTFSVRKQAKYATQRFYTDGYLPMNVIGMTWQALYKQRMNRL